MADPRKRKMLHIDSLYLSQETLTWAKVVTGLATLQDAIQTLSTAYIKHTNAVLGEHGAGLDVESALAKLGDNPLLRLGDLNRAASPAKSVVAEAAAPDKKERKKRQHDPNAPKRPLTPFFLYMQTARPIIAEDLGPEVAKGAVSTEGTRRWQAMNPDDKQVRPPPPREPPGEDILTDVALDQRIQGQPSPVQRPYALLQGRQCGSERHD
jgi:hypothetical protein